ncbi:ABC transporter C family member 13 isoform X1 [Ananas comosus]|uniref:ABC-type xenobiotic transporter n=3 Tax=Ananas comosus TaxID=4615 RepID=A0A6P5ELC2_ANACO|nr:ABC transporter C family member 13 isoform X1 [Ananas comosus]
MFMDLICPRNPIVWDGNRFAPCFADMVLGFGANVITIVAVLVVFFTRNDASRTVNIQKSLLEKLFLHAVPAFGACLSFYDILLLLMKSLEGHDPEYYEWFFRCSQCATWMLILVFSTSKYWFSVFCNPFLCLWWILKPLLEIPHLQYKFLSPEVITCFKESSSVSAELMFGLFVNVIRATSQSYKRRELNSIEDPFIPQHIETNEGRSIYLVRKFGNFWHLVTFKFINSMMDVGLTKQLDFEDLVQLPPELTPVVCYDELLNCWIAEQSKHHSDSSLLRAMYYAYGWPYFRLGLLKVINDAIGFVGPLLLNRLISFLQQGSSNIEGYILAFALGFTSLFKSFLDTQYTFRLSKLKLMLRSSIMTIVYHKCLYINLAERSKFSKGEIQTFMSIDADRTINLCNSLHDVWSLPLQIGLALCLLYTQVSFAFVSGLALTILLIPVNKWISGLIASATEKMMKQKDERIRSAGELLAFIRTLKMYSWEDLFMKRLMERREMEVKHLSTRKYLDAWCVYFWATTPTLFSLFTFGMFALMGHSLDAATVFTCVALFNTLISPLNSFPWVINGMIDAIISARRLSKYLSCLEHKYKYEQRSLEEFDKDGTDANGNATGIIFRDASFSWSSRNEVGQSADISGISLGISKGLLVAIIGEVGSGKSSLINSVLGEMNLTYGFVRSHGSIAYVPQVPWILSGSLRDNVLFGKEFDRVRYGEVLEACTLDVDISKMIGGDVSYIGEKGVNLSGGQRARLALARAVYHDSDIYLLDDILSAVDSQVALWILHRAILSPLMNRKTRLLCTHNLQAISSADMIIIMDKGHVKWAGTSASYFTSPYSNICAPDSSNVLSSTPLEKGNWKSSSNGKQSKLPLDSDFIASEQSTESIEVELRKEGKVGLDVYKSYAVFASWPVVIIICVSAFLMQASRNGNDLWLSHWVDTSTGTEYTRFYLVILAVFGLMNSLFTLARSFSFAYGGLRAAILVHTKILDKLLNAPVYFFDHNPSGRVLNRLSSDLYTIDDSLPFILNILLANFFGLLGIAFVLSYAQILFLLLLVPFGYIYRKLQFYYRATSRELRRLDSVARSPIYSSFTETLDGSSTIRAFAKEELFMARFMEHVSLYQRTTYSELTAGLWLSLRLQLLAAFIILFIAVMAVVGCHRDFPINFGTPGLVGLALSYAAPVVSLLSSFLSSFTETEKEMVSVERVGEYMDIPQEDLQGSQPLDLNWPNEGQIEFQHVTLKYKPSLPAALNDVSFRIAAGMQVGIVGRTGAGKSSVLNALFRLNPICNGRILVDGVDVADVAVRVLRGHFAVVPQSPFLFEGSLRENLDPYGRASDWKIWEALEKCHMKAEVESAGGLDIHVKESGTSFSVGQRQLICLARAIIKSSKILCLDECTANVDTQTALLLQSTISDECKGMTILTIAHRISTVLEMDNILVLDHGILVEQGNPQDLLDDECSRFSSYAKASTM